MNKLINTSKKQFIENLDKLSEKQLRDVMSTFYITLLSDSNEDTDKRFDDIRSRIYCTIANRLSTFVSAKVPLDKSTNKEKMSFFLCSEAVVQHFPDVIKSKPFKSGYVHEKDDNFYIIHISNQKFDMICEYYNTVIEPFNDNSRHTTIDFWLRECTDSQLEEPSKRCMQSCRDNGVFVTLFDLYGLSNESNQAFGIWKMANMYGLTPIEFINKVTK